MSEQPKKQPTKNALIFLGSLATLVVLGLVYFIIQNGVTNAGNTKQQELIALYNNTTNVLSDCEVKTKSAAGVATANEAALNKVITDAVRGRYTAGSTAQPGSGKNALFNAIAENYPDTSGLSKTFENVQIIINGCRSDFRDSQTILQAAVAQFVQWKTGSFTVRTFGGSNYPNNELAIKKEGKVVTGNEALTQMRELVVVAEAQEGRDTGKITNESPFPTK
jgi:hypothetical protein